MNLLAPYWLLAASAILIPIAIHLWNKRQGKTVKVGSIRWLEASASKQWRSIKLTEVGLLLLRCLILLLLAVALAKPVLEKYSIKEQSQKAIYISPELLYSEAVTTLKSTIDPLLVRGYSLYTFAPTFTAVPQEQWQQLSTHPSDSIVESGNYWELLPALAQKYPQTQDSIWLFTSDQQRHFRGKPTPLQENITWIPVTLKATTNWIQTAYTSASDSVLLIAGQSSREGTTYTRHRIPRSTTPLKAGILQVRLFQQNDTLWAFWGDQQQQRVLVQQQPFRISIMASKAQESEVKYLQAAVKSISSYTGIPIEVQQAAPTIPDWLFWLTPDAIPDSVLQLVEQGMRLWIQPGEKPTPTNASLVTQDNTIRLYQLSGATPEKEHIIWSTSNGEPLLATELLGKGKVYHFRSGFSPTWSRLGQSAQLPDLLLPFFLPDASSSTYDARSLPDELLKPAIKDVPSGTGQEEQDYNLLPWLVSLAFMLFLAERFIAGRRVKG